MSKQETGVLKKDEPINIYDSQNNFIGVMSRQESREKKQFHRSSCVLVYSEREKGFVVQKRSMRKSYCPGYYDLVTGGVMGPDDKDDYDNACRELMEELGIPEEKFMGASDI